MTRNMADLVVSKENKRPGSLHQHHSDRLIPSPNALGIDLAGVDIPDAPA